MVTRKGQAAMEYLMTYGWAILIVLAIMGILVYLVRPQQIESCNIAMPFQCQQEKFRIDSTQNLSVSLLNLGSIAYVITNTTCPAVGDNKITYIYPNGLEITPGSSKTVYFNCSMSSNAISNPTVGKDAFKDTVLITYYPLGSPEFVKSQQLEIVV